MLPLMSKSEGFLVATSRRESRRVHLSSSTGHLVGIELALNPAPPPRERHESSSTWVLTAAVIRVQS